MDADMKWVLKWQGRSRLGSKVGNQGKKEFATQAAAIKFAMMLDRRIAVELEQVPVK
jgi:hypothetical protein